MKDYRIIPRTDLEHERDMDLLDYLQRKVEWCDKMKSYENLKRYERAADLYAELESTHAELSETKEDRDYYREKCRENGIQ